MHLQISLIVSMKLLILKTTKHYAKCRQYPRTYLYAGLFVKHSYHKCRRTTTGMFSESQSKTLPRNKGWKEKLKVKMENALYIIFTVDSEVLYWYCNHRTWPLPPCSSVKATHSHFIPKHTLRLQVKTL